MVLGAMAIPGALGIRLFGTVRGLPEGEHPGRDLEAVFPAVVLEVEIDALLADQVELIAVAQLTQLVIFGFQDADPGTQLLNFPGIPEVNDQMDALLFHAFGSELSKSDNH